MIKIINLDTRTTRYTNDEDVAFDIINRITCDEELAIEMSSWAGLATVGDQWIAENVDVEIIEE